MCGLAGVILGAKRRRRDELRIIGGLFTELLLLAQERGVHASGVAVVRRDGSYKLFKRPGPAADLVDHKLYSCVLALDNRVTAVLGHTRWKTHGSEFQNANNGPQRVGRVCGSHNGILFNADRLVRSLGLPRTAEVDSEVLFRLADRARTPAQFRRLLAACRGHISAAFVKLDHPATVHLLKGDRPLSAVHVPRLRAIFYASRRWMLEQALVDFDHQRLELPRMTLSMFNVGDLLDYRERDVAFQVADSSLGGTRR